MQAEHDDVNLLGREKNWLEKNRKAISIVSVLVGTALFAALAAGLAVALTKVSAPAGSHLLDLRFKP